MASVYKVNVTGSAAIALSITVPESATYQLISVTMHADAAATTSENFTVTLDANAGAVYDTLLYSLDLSAASTVNLLWQPDSPLFLEGGDAIDVAFANTDTDEYGVQITVLAI